MENNIQHDNINNEKKISICGTNNRYMMKKVLQKNNINKKRVEINNLNFPDDYFQYEKQYIFLNEIYNNNFKYTNKITEVIIKQINKKISGYKQQDLLKKRYNEIEFLDFENVINKLIESELKCYYCKSNLLILYDIVREIKQWSVDRIDNDLGHDKNNFHISCLECNLQRRKKTDKNFLFTKQLNIVKKENENI